MTTRAKRKTTRKECIMCHTKYDTHMSNSRTCSDKCRTKLHRFKRRAKKEAIQICDRLDSLFAVAILGHKEAKRYIRDIFEGTQKMCQELGA